MKTITVRALTVLLLLAAPVMMLWAQETNKKYALTTQMFLNELKEQAKQSVDAQRQSQVRRRPDGRPMPKPQRLIARPDTVGGVAYISCFIHLKDVGDLSAVRALGVEVEETFDGLEYATLTYVLEDGDDYVEIAFWLDGGNAEAEAKAIMDTLASVQR